MSLRAPPFFVIASETWQFASSAAPPRLLWHCSASQRQREGKRDCLVATLLAKTGGKARLPRHCAPRKDGRESEIASALRCLAKTGGKPGLLRHWGASQRRGGNRDCGACFESQARNLTPHNDRRKGTNFDGLAMTRRKSGWQ